MSEASGTTVGFKKADQQITITHTKAAASFLPKSLRMLKDMEEDTWLSGGELQTDNSSSEDDEQGEEFTPFGGARSKTKGKKKVNTIRKIASFTKTIAMSSTSSHSSSSKTKSVHKQFANEQGIEEVEEFISSSESKPTTKSEYLRLDTEEEDFHWRPKRGSISLLGLTTTEFEQIQIK